MKAQHIQSILLTLITKTEDNRELLAKFARNLEEEHFARQELFDDLHSLPKYMNYVLAEEAEKETKAKANEMMELLCKMDAVLSSEAAAYKYEFDFGK